MVLVLLFGFMTVFGWFCDLATFGVCCGFCFIYRFVFCDLLDLACLG